MLGAQQRPTGDKGELIEPSRLFKKRQMIFT